MKLVKIDYSEYTLEQLQALLMFIDSNKYPEREKEICKQITMKQRNLVMDGELLESDCKN